MDHAPEQHNIDLSRPIGGYTDIARYIERRCGRVISKQQVWMWWHRRAQNGFPSGWDRPTRGGGVREFYLDEVLIWHYTRYQRDEHNVWHHRPRH